MDRKNYSKQIVDQLVMISMFLQKTGNRQIAHYGLNQPQFAVLGEITQTRDLNQTDILGSYLLEKSNLSKIIKKLEKMKLITIRISKLDKRKTILNATKEGRRLWSECMGSLDELKEVFIAPLTDDEIKQIHEVITKLTLFVHEHSKDTSPEKGKRNE